MLHQLHRIVATVVLVLALGAPQGFAAPRVYGAIAYSPSRGVDGFSFNFKSRSAAQRAALQYCRQRAKGCRIVANFSGACGALAVGRKAGWGAATGNGRTQARSRAISACRKYGTACRIQRSVCS